MLEQPPSPPPSTLDSRPYAPSPVRCPSAPRLLTLSRIATTQIPFIATPGMKSKSSHVVRNFSLSNLAALNQYAAGQDTSGAGERDALSKQDLFELDKEVP